MAKGEPDDPIDPDPKAGQGMPTLASESPKIFFNGINAANGSYAIPPMLPEDFAEHTRDSGADIEKALPPYLRDPEFSNLAILGWGVVFGKSVPRAHRKALQPLLDFRRDQAGDLFKGDLQTAEDDGLIPFLEINGGGLDFKAEEIPYFLLLVGSPDDISFGLQASLGQTYAVGRLYFETAEEYANYARNALAAEKGEVQRPRDRQIELFATRNWDDANTSWSERFLVQTLEQDLGSIEGFHLNATYREQATKTKLSRLLGDQCPGVLLASCHGMLFPAGHEKQAQDQGAMLCYDWPGPRIWGRQPIPEGFYFSARDLDSSSDLRGLVTFFFGCFSLGTPTLDTYHRGTKTPRHLTHRAFLASLPRKMLGLDKGALAVFGHVDQAWCHSYYWQRLGAQVGHFEGAIETVLRGGRAGAALSPFSRRMASLGALIVEENRRRAKESGSQKLSADEKQMLLWTARYDAYFYTLLGDPAARIERRPVETASPNERRQING